MATSVGSAAAPTPPKKLHQLVIWLVALAAIAGVFLMAQMGSGEDTASAAPAASITQTTSDAGTSSTTTTGDSSTRIVSAPSGFDDADALAACLDNEKAPTASALPAMRWTDFSLYLYDGSWFFKTNAMISQLAGFFFVFADMMWRVLFWFINFGITFSPLCGAAKGINSSVAVLGSYASFFAIPAVLYWLWTARKLLLRRQTGRALMSLIIMVGLLGGLFYVTDTASKLEDQNADKQTIMTTAGSVPWMAHSIMSALSTASTAMSEVAEFDNDADDPTRAFYDNPSVEGRTNHLSCYAFVYGGKNGATGLYQKYSKQVSDDKVGDTPQVATMKQMSHLWEVGYLSSWIAAQFGYGSEDGNQLPSKVACRHLETTVDTSYKSKAQMFYDVQGGAAMNDWSVDQIIGSGLVGFMSPIGGVHKLPVDFAWSMCSYASKGWTYDRYYEDMSRASDKNVPCYPSKSNANRAMQYHDGGKNNDLKKEDIQKVTHDAVLDGDGNPNSFDDGEDDVEDIIGYDHASDDARNFARSAIGQNAGLRIAQGAISLVVAAVYLWSFAPMALGLVIAAVALIILLALLPVSVFLTAVQMKAGPRLLKLTGASAAATFLFGLLLTFLTMIVKLLTTGVASVLDGSGMGSNMARQIIISAIPVAAILILKKMASALGLGNITSLSGAMGMTSAMAAKAAGSKQDVAGKFSGAGSKLAAGSRAAARGLAGSRKDGKPSAVQRMAQSRLLNKKGKNGNTMGQALAQKGKAAGSDTGMVAKRLGSRLANSKLGQRTGRAAAAIGNSRFGQGVSNKMGSVGNAAKKTGAWLGDPNKNLAMKRGMKIAGATAGLTTLGALTGGIGPGAIMAGAGVAGGSLGLAKPVGMLGNWSRDKLNKWHAEEAMNKMTPAELKATESSWHPGQMNVESSKDAKGAQKRAIAARQHIGRIKNPEERDKVLKEYVKSGLDSSRATLHGGNSESGVNASFSGFDNPIEQERARQEVAAQLKVNPGDVVMGSHGLTVPAATIGSARQKNGAPKLPDGVSIEMAGHPALYMDQATSARRADESDDDYSARITATAQARGLVDDKGQFVNVFQKAGIDTNTEAGSQRVTKWLDGGSDPTLEQITFNPVRGENLMVRQAASWSKANSVDMVEVQRNAVAQQQEIHSQALKDAQDVGSIPVRLEPATSSSTATARMSMTDGDVRMPKQSTQQERTVTVKETMNNLSERTSKIHEALDNAGSSQESVREAARSLDGLDGLEQDVRGLLDGLQAASLARASVSMDHYAMGTHGNADINELREASNKVMARSKEEAETREDSLGKQMTRLFHDAKVARNAPSAQERKEALAAASAHLKNIEESSKALYEEEDQEGKQIAEMLAEAKEAEEAQRTLDEQQRSVRKPPSRSVVSSRSVLEAQAEQRG